MDELFAVSISLSSQNVDEDQNKDVSNPVSGVLNNAVSEKEDNSDILETVAGEEESNSGGLNGITQHWLNFLLNSASVIDGLSILNHGQEISFGFKVVGVLELNYILLV